MEQIELQAKLLNYFLGSNKSNINQSRALVAWRGGLFLTEGKIVVLSVVFSIFNAGGSVCGCVRVYTNTYTHYIDGVFGCEPRSRDGTPGGPEESKLTKSRHTYIRICVQSTHVYIFAKRWDEILDYLLFSFNMSLSLLRKVEDVATISKPQSLTSVRMKDCTLRVPNKTTKLFFLSNNQSNLHFT